MNNVNPNACKPLQHWFPAMTDDECSFLNAAIAGYHDQEFGAEARFVSRSHAVSIIRESGYAGKIAGEDIPDGIGDDEFTWCVIRYDELRDTQNMSDAIRMLAAEIKNHVLLEYISVINTDGISEVDDTDHDLSDENYIGYL